MLGSCGAARDFDGSDPRGFAAVQGERSKLEVLAALLEEVPEGAWLLWADNDVVFANRGFSFPFYQYQAAGKHLIIAGSQADVIAGNAHRAPHILPLAHYNLCSGPLSIH